jgi:hypothetical protein
MKKLLLILALIVSFAGLSYSCDEDCYCSRKEMLKVMKQMQEYLPEPNPCDQNCLSGLVWVSSSTITYPSSMPPQKLKSQSLREEAKDLEEKQSKIDDIKDFIRKCEDKI